jgi:hypothetical protein
LPTLARACFIQGENGSGKTSGSGSFTQAQVAPSVAAANQEITPKTEVGEIKLVWLGESRIRQEPDTPVSGIQFRSKTIVFGQVSCWDYSSSAGSKNL